MLLISPRFKYGLHSTWVYISRDRLVAKKKGTKKQTSIANFTKDTKRVANFTSSVARMQREGFLATEKVEIFPCFTCVCSIASEAHSKGVIWGWEHASGSSYSQPHTMCAVICTLCPFPSSLSGPAHGNHYCSLTPEALPTLAAM